MSGHVNHCEEAGVELEGKVAIVTGAAAGIGRAIAGGLAASGASVVVDDVDEAGAKEVAAGIRANGGRAEPCPIGVGTDAAAAEIVRCATDTFGGLHLLVNNAGVGGDAPLVELSEEQLKRSVSVNLVGPILLAKHAAGVMVEQRYGKVVNITSRSGLRGKYGESGYSAGKAGMAGFTLTMAIEMAPYGINVNAVAPAAWTALLENMPEPERSRTIAKREDNVLGRVARPADVVPTVVWLLSDAAEYVTGQIIEATGQQASLL
ncbi:MAG: SDR family oxidoreductase [Streptosporangiales bacterium]|nr:SDR family oxidoreductase [Streptosporangiales bacterium]